MTGDLPSDLQREIERAGVSLRRRSTTVTIARGISYVAYAWLLASLIILAFGFLLLLFGANPDAGFTQWIYRHLTDTMEPFRGIFPQATTSTGATLDVSVLFAMFVYSLVGLGVRSLIDWLTYRRDRLERMERDHLALQRSQVARQQAGMSESRMIPPDSTGTYPRE